MGFVPDTVGEIFLHMAQVYWKPPNPYLNPTYKSDRALIQETIKQLSNSELKALRKAAWNMKTQAELRSWLDRNESKNSQTQQNQPDSDLGE